MALFEVEAGKTPLSFPRLVSNSLLEPDLDNAKYVKLHMNGGAMGRGGSMIYNGEEVTKLNFLQSKQFWAFNGVSNVAEDPLFTAKPNQTIIMEIFNGTAFLHAMHVHGHHFRVIDRSDSTVDEGQPWRDTFLIGPEQVTKIAFVADNPGKWLLHCHMLEHAAAGMNTWFEVS